MKSHVNALSHYRILRHIPCIFVHTRYPTTLITSRPASVQTMLIIIIYQFVRAIKCCIGGSRLYGRSPCHDILMIGLRIAAAYVVPLSLPDWQSRIAPH